MASSTAILLFALQVAILKESCSQLVTVIISPNLLLSDNGTAATLVSAFAVADPGYTLDNIEWFKESDLIADFFGGATNPRHLNPDYPADEYPVSRDDTVTNLTIAAVKYDKDEGIFLCRASFIQGFSSATNESSAELRVYVLPTVITLSNATHVFSKGETLMFNPGDQAIFTCEVPDVIPEATISWLLDNKPVSSDGPVSPTPEMNPDGLYTSRSTYELEVAAGQKSFGCLAFNKPGHGGIATHVNLEIQASTTPASTTEYGITSDLGSDTTKEPPSSTDPPNGLSVGAIVGIAIGCVVFVVVMIGIFTYCCCKKQEKQKRKDDMTMGKPVEGEEKSHLEKDDRDAS